MTAVLLKTTTTSGRVSLIVLREEGQRGCNLVEEVEGVDRVQYGTDEAFDWRVVILVLGNVVGATHQEPQEDRLQCDSG